MNWNTYIYAYSFEIFVSDITTSSVMGVSNKGLQKGKSLASYYPELLPRNANWQRPYWNAIVDLIHHKCLSWFVHRGSAVLTEWIISKVVLPQTNKQTKCVNERENTHGTVMVRSPVTCNKCKIVAVDKPFCFLYNPVLTRTKRSSRSLTFIYAGRLCMWCVHDNARGGRMVLIPDGSWGEHCIMGSAYLHWRDCVGICMSVCISVFIILSFFPSHTHSLHL